MIKFSINIINSGIIDNLFYDEIEKSDENLSRDERTNELQKLVDFFESEFSSNVLPRKDEIVLFYVPREIKFSFPYYEFKVEGVNHNFYGTKVDYSLSVRYKKTHS